MSSESINLQVLDYEISNYGGGLEKLQSPLIGKRSFPVARMNQLIVNVSSPVGDQNTCTFRDSSYQKAGFGKTWHQITDFLLLFSQY